MADENGLTEAEKVTVRNIWNEVKKDVAGNGYDLFIRFFTENPTYQQHFKAFKDVPLSELRGNKKLLAHANNVLYAITMLVDNLDDVEVLVEMLEKLGTNHKRRNITIEKFENLKITVMGLFEDKLGTEIMNAGAVDAWDKTFNIMFSVIAKGLE